MFWKLWCKALGEKASSKEEYYNKYDGTVSPYCYCGNKKTFRSLGVGYLEFCSCKCRSNNDEIRNKISQKNKGKTQSDETVRKRVENTDQTKKEQTRKNTMLERYGVDNPMRIEEIKQIVIEKSIGRKLPTRTEEHSQKIIESKRQNGTLNHSDSTRSKIIDSLNRYYQEGNNQSITVTSLPSNGRGHKTGYHNGILYRSSYELSFIIFCEKNNIEIESCETKERRVRYEYEGKKRWYYPDFYLPVYDICVEIKPVSMMNKLFYIKKKAAESVYNNFIVITENELVDEVKLNEYISCFE
jgi:hypothetical protein